VPSASYDAVVVGGGFAGVVAARELAEAGRATLLLEARDRLGGRTWYRPFRGDGRYVELGGTWISSRTMHRARAEVERYGLRLTHRKAPGIDFRWRLDGSVRQSFPLEGEDLYELERAWVDLVVAARRLDPDRPLDEQRLADLDRPVAALLDSLGLSSRPRMFLDTWARLGAGAESHEWSALQLLAWISALGCSVLGYFAEVSEYLEQGTASLLDAMVTGGGFELELESPVAKIRDSGDEIVVTTAAGTEVRAGGVVVAVPVNLWSGIEFEPALTGARLELAAEGHPGRMQKVWVHARGVPPNVVALGAESAFLWLSAEHELSDGVLLVGFASPPQGVRSGDRAAVETAVRELLPAADVVAVDSHDWADDPWSRGTWMAPRPGRLSSWSEVQAPQGRIAFAGADIATRWVGWIDGAIESGARAARQLIGIEGKENGG
jgi:monoamine oxidase